MKTYLCIEEDPNPNLDDPLFLETGLYQSFLPQIGDIIIHSIILPADGSYGHYLVSQSGETGKDLTGDELFKAWVMMAKTIVDNPTTSPNKASLAAALFETVRESMLQSSEPPASKETPCQND